MIDNPNELFLVLINETSYMTLLDPESRKVYIESTKLTTEEKLQDLDFLVEYFEGKEEYEKCGYLMGIKNQITSL